MRKPTKREWSLIALVAAVIGVAGFIDQGEEPATTEPVAKKTRSDAKPDARVEIADLDLTLLRREASPAEQPDAFPSKSWYVPPPPPPPPPPAPVVAPPPPPPPTAPPLPFTFLGLYQGGDKPVVFLARGDRVLTVSAGEVIEGTYRVDGVTGSNMALTYLPLNIKQNLFIGNAG